MNFNKNYLFLFTAVLGFASAEAQDSQAKAMPGINVNYMDYSLSYLGVAFDPNIGSVPNEITIKSKNMAINLRSNFYFIDPKKRKTKSEAYVGFGIGYKLGGQPKVSSQYPEYTPSIQFAEIYNFGFEVTVGYRYNFSKHWAFYTELGIAKSILQIGVTAKF